MEYTGVETIGVMPPVLETIELSPVPLPNSPSILGNVRQRALTNGTFQLPTSATISGTQSKVTRLHQGTQANLAIVLCEAHPDALPGAILARFWQDGSSPSPTNGLHFKDGGVIEIVGNQNIENFRIITADDLAHVLQVQYFV